MKCPLLGMGHYANPNATITYVTDCGQGECAWWDEDKNCCSIKVIAKELTRIQLKGIKVSVAR